MATEVLLTADVRDLGVEGDVVKVADGYARNYLLPRKLAAPVTVATRRRLEKTRRDREANQKAKLEVARERAAKLEGASCTITAKTGEKEQLYGSVGSAEIAQALCEQGLEVDKHTLLLEKPIKELGVFEVKARLHPEVEATIKVWVVEE